MTGIRLMTPDDAAEVTALLVAHREFLAPWEPVRTPEWFTEAGQRRQLEHGAREHAAGRHVPWGITDDSGALVGRVTINDVVHGPFESGHLGYWLAGDRTGRGVASAAVALVLAEAFGPLKLHRLQAGTLVHNVASQKVLGHNGFERIGMAPRYLRIAGRWQDHLLFQRLAEDPTEQPSA